MFKRNRDFILATATILIQQLLLAGSTWSIAAAGAAVSLDDYASAKEYVIGFFALALAAYITSSFSEVFANNAANSIWRNYSNQIVLKVSADGELSSANNRKLVSQWISTEAGTTISSASGYYLGSVSVIANILLTSVVFFATLGPVISGSIIVSLVISLAFVLLAKSRIRQLSTKIQVLRMNAIGHIENWLVNGFFWYEAHVG